MLYWLMKYVPCSSSFKHTAKYNDIIYFYSYNTKIHKEIWSACPCVSIDITEGILYMNKASTS